MSSRDPWAHPAGAEPRGDRFTVPSGSSCRVGGQAWPMSSCPHWVDRRSSLSRAVWTARRWVERVVGWRPWGQEGQRVRRLLISLHRAAAWAGRVAPWSSGAGAQRGPGAHGVSSHPPVPQGPGVSRAVPHPPCRPSPTLQLPRALSCCGPGFLLPCWCIFPALSWFEAA